MIRVPRDLYTKDVTSFLSQLIEDENIKYFDEATDYCKGKLVSLAIKALGCDVEIILGSKANKQLADCLISCDRDDQIELLNSIQEAAFERFEPYFDIMIEEIRDEIKSDRLMETGFRSYKDSQTGEVLWRKSA